MMITDYDVYSETCYKQRIIKDVIKRAKELESDPDKINRKAGLQCQHCYYTEKIGGAAMTKSNCRICESEMLFGNTNIDEICLSCAKEYKLCKHCKAELNLKNRRKPIFINNKESK